MLDSNVGLDIIVVLKKGIEAKNFYLGLYEEQSKIRNTRLIYFIPNNGVHKIKDKYNQFANRMYDSQEGDHFPVYVLGNISLEDFASNPLIRFMDDPKPDNIALIVDEWFHTGLTLQSTVRDLKQLGYREKKIFGYIYDVEHHRHSSHYFDSKQNNISPLKFYDLIQE